jgi:peptide chain release factor 3
MPAAQLCSSEPSGYGEDVSLTEVNRRRTFAVISHPDAGKTTLTEKLLLFSGAIQIAGAVKGRKSRRFATSDWMEIEKQRGISVASSVMQFEYGDAVVNLLDTPGHDDFSEDTYRVLTAVDAAVMVIDGVNGVEAQTIKLLEVCRRQRTPIITFINKLDREVRSPIELLGEVEHHLGVAAIPFSWPIGTGKEFRGVYDIRHGQIRRFGPGETGDSTESITLDSIDDPRALSEFGAVWEGAKDEIELVSGATPDFERAAFLEGEQSPVLFGSAINNFGVRELLDALVELAPPPSVRAATQRPVDPAEARFTGLVFKVQANMDPQHRDRVAFVRVCSGQFQRGMSLTVSKTGKRIKTGNVVTFLSQRRDLAEEAYPGDIIGIPNHGSICLGDTLTEGEALQFPGLPFFSPEIFQTVEAVDPIRVKQLNEALRQLSEEGAIQVFRPMRGGALLLGAVGALQFEVVAHRLATEYRVEVRFLPSSYRLSRWISSTDAAAMKRFVNENAARLATDAADSLALLAKHPAEIAVLRETWPELVFSEMREFNGDLAAATPR